jgi:hypothetical protein
MRGQPAPKKAGPQLEIRDQSARDLLVAWVRILPPALSKEEAMLRIGQTKFAQTYAVLNDSPQPHVETALGFSTTKPPPMSFSDR